MGKITSKLFETIGIPVARFPTKSENINTTIETALANMQESSLPQALILEKGSVAPYTLKDQTAPIAAKNQRFIEEPSHANLLTRHEVLKKLVQATNDEKTVLIATTGYTGRELYAINDRANHLYMVGSMGCASSLALGLALARPDLKVVIIDGDGAALMRMGNLATIGAYSPSNLKHVLLDNEAHDSTGGQQTVSRATDFSKIALACGYQHVWRSDSLKYLDDFLGNETEKGCHFMHVKIRAGTIENLPRPAIKPAEVLQRFMRTIASTDSNNL
jgi:phosphonopyruvate decarboxylase